MRLLSDSSIDCATDIETSLAMADGIVNTTPVGMTKYPGLPFAVELLQPRHWVAEVVYFPAETELLRRARARLPHPRRQRHGDCPGRARLRALYRQGSGPARNGRSLRGSRSEEHTSELQSLMRISYAVFCLKKKTPH